MTLNILQRVEYLLISLLLAFLGAIDRFGGWLSVGKYRRSIYYVTLSILSVVLILSSQLPQKYILQSMSTNFGKNSISPKVEDRPNLPLDVNGLTIDSTGDGLDHMLVEAKIKPELKQKIAFPFITAKAHVIVDVGSGEVLSEHNIKRTFAPASTTKLMTALVALDIYSLNETLAMTQTCQEIDSSKLWLPVGMEFTIKDLLYALLVSSAGDAGCLLANGKVTQDQFVEKMNEKAKKLGMVDSNFKNPVGLDGVNGSHYSTVWDLYLLSSAAMKNPVISQIVKTKNYTFSNTGNDIEVNISNTNKLLWDLTGTVGIKTGTTSGAGEVLVYQYADGQKAIRVIMMSSEDRFLETKELVEWTLSSYEWK